MYTGRYVYCVIPSGKKISFGKIGIGGRGDEVYTIPYRDISAVVSATPLIEYEPNEVNALAHERVVEKAGRRCTVLPMKFNTTFASEDHVKRTLARLYTIFKSELKRLEGKVEVGVKVFWSPEVAMKKIEETSEEIVRLKEEIAKTPGTLEATYSLKMRLEKLINDELNKKAEDYSLKIFEALKKCAEDAKASKLIGHMIVNGVFLARRDRIREFKKELRKIQSEYREMEFKYSGPWSPYNFVAIRFE